MRGAEALRTINYIGDRVLSYYVLNAPPGSSLSPESNPYASCIGFGRGKIGRMIARFLMDSGDYDVLVGDLSEPALERIAKLTGAAVRHVDATNPSELDTALEGRETVLSALSFHHNPTVARAALTSGSSYFDLTEDVATSDAVAAIAESAAEGQIFMPQCGLAPGFISIAANDLINWFERIETVKMRVGALPQFPTGELKYNLTWSTDGLINEYCNPCEAIHAGKKIDVLPLEGLEHFSLDGVRYEAFNTSGGLGTLCDTLAGKVRELNYKTVRYVGHRDQMKLLVDELRMSEHREQFKEIAGARGARDVPGRGRHVLHGDRLAEGLARAEERRAEDLSPKNRR